MKKIAKKNLMKYVSLSCMAMLAGGMLTVVPQLASAEAPTSFLIKNGAEVRVESPSGIRFTAQIAVADYDATATYGMIILPTAMLGEAELTHALDYELDVVATNWEQKDETTLVYKVALAEGPETEFLSENYLTNYSARAYVKYADGTYEYTTDTVSRNIAWVSSAALYDLNDGENHGQLLYDVVNTVVGDGLAFAKATETVKTTDTLTLDLTGDKGLVVRYASDNENVLTVDAKTGAVTIKAEGTANVTATVGNKVATKVVTVKDGVALTAVPDLDLTAKTMTVAEIAEETITEITVGTQTYTAGQFTQNGATITLADVSAITTQTGEQTLVLKGASTYEGKACVVTMCIDSVADMEKMVKTTHTMTDYYVLTDNVDFDNNYGDGYWGLVGNDKAIFKGTFDGRGYQIKNRRVQIQDLASGLLGTNIAGESTNNAYTTVKNLAITGANRFGKDWCGLLAATIDGYVNIENVYIEGVVADYSSAGTVGESGLFAGRLRTGVVFKNCVAVNTANSGTLNYGNIGTFAGLLYGPTTFTNCYGASLAGTGFVKNENGKTVTYNGGSQTIATSKQAILATITSQEVISTLPMVKVDAENNVYWGRYPIGTLA